MATGVIARRSSRRSADRPVEACAGLGAGLPVLEPGRELARKAVELLLGGPEPLSEDGGAVLLLVVGGGLRALLGVVLGKRVGRSCGQSGRDEIR